MKIWILTTELPPDFGGGIARYVENVARALVRQGQDVTVFTRGKEAGESAQSGLKIVRIVPGYENLATNAPDVPVASSTAFPYNVMAYWPAFSHQMADLIIRYIGDHGAPDVIEAQEYAALPYYLIQRKLLGEPALQGVPILLHLHSPNYELAEANKEPAYRFPVYWVGQMEKFCIRAADALLCPSQWLADRVQKELSPRSSVEVIPLPTAVIEEKRPVEASADEIPTVLYFGRLEVRKGVLAVLKAATRLWAEGRTFRIKMVGGDTDYFPRGTSVATYIKRKYARQIEDGALLLCAALAFDELQEEIRRSAVIVIPSLWENFPNTCIEAMSSGKVVVASTDGGQADLIGSDGTAGVLFSWEKPGDVERALRHALSMDTATAARMGESARHRVLSYCSADKVVERRVAHYGKIRALRSRPDLFPTSWSGYEPPVSVATELIGQRQLISVVITYYNLGEFLPDALSSALASEEVELEVVIVNDGSTDQRSLDVLDELRAKGDPRIRIVDKKNEGLAAARNTGAAHARGEYLAFLDADDVVAPDFYRRCRQILETYPNVGFVYSWVQYFGNSHAVWPTWNAEFPYILGHNMLVPIAVVRRGAFLASGGNKVQFEYNFEDYECWVEMLARGWLGISIPELLTRYRVRAGSLLRQANDDQFVYLYDLMVRTHPKLYERWGGELMRLQVANGSSMRWDHPAVQSPGSIEDYVRTLEKQRDVFWNEVQILGRAWEDHVKHITAQDAYIKQLQAGANRPEALAEGERYQQEHVTMLEAECRTLREMLESSSSERGQRMALTWEQRAGANMIRKLRSMPPVRFALRLKFVYKWCESFLNSAPRS